MKLLLKTHEGNTRVIADSAIGRQTQPWFLPDFGSNWRWRKALAVRVGRLGKELNPKFLDRYVDGISLIWVAEADGCPALDYMDGAVVCGTWVQPERLPDELAAELIAASHYATMKTGDIVALELPGDPEPIEPGKIITLQFDNKEIIRISVK